MKRLITILFLLIPLFAFSQTSRRTATNEDVSTYGDGTREYTVLATWEAASDTNIAAGNISPVLECYDDAASFDDNVDLAGATTSAAYFRIIRAASGEGHDGTPNNGITFDNTTDLNGFEISESYSQFQDLILINTLGSGNSRRAARIDGANSKVIGCLIKSTNSGAGDGVGFIVAADGCIAVNVLVWECEGDGLTIATTGANEDTYLYSCTSVDNGDDGVVLVTVGGSTGTVRLRNVLSTGSTSNDFERTGADGTIDLDYCCSEDATADNWGVNNNLVSKTITYTNAAGDDYHTQDSDIQSLAEDLSGDVTFAFDDDIDIETRVGWDIGFDEYIVPAVTTTGQIIMIHKKKR